MRTKNLFLEQSKELHAAIKCVVDLFGLSLAQEESDAYGFEAVYKNGVAGVKFQFSPSEDVGWRGVIGQLIDGQFPRHPIRIDRDTPLYRFDLRDVASERIELIPELAGKIADADPLSARDLMAILERCCPDLFVGDFSLFAPLRLRVMSRLSPAKRPDH